MTWRAGGAQAHASRGVSFAVILSFIVVSLLLSLWGAQRWIEKRDIQSVVSRLESTPGVAAISAHRADRGWVVNLAADPSVNIEPALEGALMPRSRMIARVDPILSLDPTTVAGVLRKTLPPPTGVRLIVTRDAVTVQGQVPTSYLDALRAHPRVRIANLAVQVATDSAIVPQ
jgi:hypothetical protein